MKRREFASHMSEAASQSTASLRISLKSPKPSTLRLGGEWQPGPMSALGQRTRHALSAMSALIPEADIERQLDQQTAAPLLERPTLKKPFPFPWIFPGFFDLSLLLS
jgi:hypothetical protein